MSNFFQLKIFLGIAVLLGLAACQPTPAKSDRPLTWWHLNTDQPGAQAIEGVAKNFEKTHPGLRIQTVPVENVEYKQKLQMILSAGTPPDVFASWGGGSMAELAQAGQLKDLTDLVKSSRWKTPVHPAALNLYTWQGRIYGFPHDMGAVGFWYNSQLLAQAGYPEFPQDWKGFITMIKTLKGKKVIPLALGISEHWPVTYYWAYLALRINGPGLFQDILEKKRTFSDPALVRSGHLLVELAQLSPFQESAVADDYPAQSRLVGDGKTAMELMGQWALGVQAQNAVAKAKNAPLMKFAPFPELSGTPGRRSDALGGANGFVVSAQAPESAAELLEFFNETPNVQKYFDAFPAIPTNREVQVSSPALNAVKTYLDQMTSFTFYPDQSYPAQVNSALNALASKMIVGELTPEQACAELQKTWEESQRP